MSLSHLEVLSKILVSAPPIRPDHVQFLVPSNLMEIGVPHIVLLSINWESSISVARSMFLVGFSESVSPLLDHFFLLYINLFIFITGSYCF